MHLTAFSAPSRRNLLFVPRLSFGAAPARGVTLVEVLVAIVVFTIGALSLAGASAVVARRLHLAQGRSLAAHIVSSRMAWVGANRCSAATSGSQDHSAGVRESWTEWFAHG
jgi:type II secretion system protein I